MIKKLDVVNYLFNRILFGLVFSVLYCNIISNSKIKYYYFKQYIYNYYQIRAYY